METTLAASRRNLLLICLVSALWSFSFGLGAPLTSLWLRDAGHSDTVIGLNTTLYYLGIALASGLVPYLMRRLGRGCVVLGTIISGLSLMALPLTEVLWTWYALRLINGIAGAMSLIPLETAVNRGSETAVRARNFGFYAFSVALGWALGNGVGLELFADEPSLILFLGGIPSILGGVVILGWLPLPAEFHVARKNRGSLQLGRDFLSYGSAWSQGFLEGGMVGFLAIYLLFLGLSDRRVSWITSGIMIGVILFQVPVAWMADRWGRRGVLIGCYAVTAGALSILPYCGDSVALVVALFAVGACSGAFYPLGLAILGDGMAQSNLARANAWYLGINCCGSLVGPFLTGAVMDHWGRPAMFFAAEFAVLSIVGIWLAIQAYYRFRSKRFAAPAAYDGPPEVSKAA